MCSAANSDVGAEVVRAVTPLTFRGHSPHVGRGTAQRLHHIRTITLKCVNIRLSVLKRVFFCHCCAENTAAAFPSCVKQIKSFAFFQGINLGAGRRRGLLQLWASSFSYRHLGLLLRWPKCLEVVPKQRTNISSDDLLLGYLSDLFLSPSLLPECNITMLGPCPAWEYLSCHWQ